MGKGFFDDLVKETGNEYAASVADGIAAGDVTEFIDTGSYILNALLSGSIYGGLPSNKITAFAGESSTGKTFFVLSIVKNFLDSHPNAGVIYFESESALTKDMIVTRGIDANRMHIVPVVTVQEFRHQAIKILDKYAEQNEDSRPPLMLCLDSLGMLSTSKEMEDTAAGSETKDMTRASIIKGAFRVLTLKLSKVKVPLSVTNHTYASIGSMYPTQELGGGAGLKYAASTIVMLTRRKEKDATDVIGNIIHCKLHKARLTKENKVVDTLLNYDSGLNKYYGLLLLAEKYGIIKKVSTRYELPDGTKVFEKSINNNPEKYLTKDILDNINEFARKEYLYGQSEIEEEKEEQGPENLAAATPANSIKEYYTVVPHKIDPQNQWMIKIIKGEFKDITYCYGKLQLNPDPKENEATCRFEYTIIDGPDWIGAEETPRFVNLAGDIIMDVLKDYFESGITQEEIAKNKEKDGKQ